MLGPDFRPKNFRCDAETRKNHTICLTEWTDNTLGLIEVILACDGPLSRFRTKEAAVFKIPAFCKSGPAPAYGYENRTASAKEARFRQR
jgi:hypothetical protein